MVWSSVVDSIAAPDTAHRLAVSHDDLFLFFGVAGSETVFVLDTDDGEVREFALDAPLLGLATRDPFDDPQRCDGRDGDCDGEVDEGFGVGDECDGVGLCEDGVLECAGPLSTVCSTLPGGSASQAVAEACNGLDDDCDGRLDEEPPPLDLQPVQVTRNPSIGRSEPDVGWYDGGFVVSWTDVEDQLGLRRSWYQRLDGDGGRLGDAVEVGGRNGGPRFEGRVLGVGELMFAAYRTYIIGGGGGLEAAARQTRPAEPSEG